MVGGGVREGCRGDLADLRHGLSREGRLAGLEVFERFYEAGSAAGLRDLEHHLEGRRRPWWPSLGSLIVVKV